jgi:hypothetical protein
LIHNVEVAISMHDDADRRQTARLVLPRPNAADRDFVADLFSRFELIAHRPHPVPDSPEDSEESHRFGR